jgi:hypothetical protein
MRRLSILIAFGLVFALFVVAAATAAPPTDFCDRPGNDDHPKCSTDSFPDCDFDASGVLSFDGTKILQCKWNADPTHTFEFQIDSEHVTSVHNPNMIVNDYSEWPSGKCFAEKRPGTQALPFPEDDLWTFSPAAKGCGDGPYLLTMVAKVKSGTIRLTDFND